VIGLVAPLEDVNDVFEALERGDVVGRAVLDVAGTRNPDSADGG
jgi:D-arabinose 1-dehydrogenase-like Zn-dependent alcohol dehydrogenase